MKRRQQVLKPRGSLDINVTPEPLFFVWQGQYRWDRHWRGTICSAGVADRGKGTGWTAWEPLMSQVKHKARGYPVPTRTGMKLGYQWIVQRRGRDLKTSVNKL